MKKSCLPPLTGLLKEIIRITKLGGRGSKKELRRMTGKMGKILIDTSIIIDHLRLKNKKQTILYRLFQNKHSLFASILTHTESYAGKSVWEKESVRKHLKNILAGIKILPLEEITSEKAGEISARFNLEIVDAIIAATSIIHNLDLATLNIKDFKKVDGIKLFKN